MIRRPPRSTLDRSSAASDVYKRQVHITTNEKLENICKVVENFNSISGRMEVVSTKPLVIVDFAHTPDGMDEDLKSFPNKEIISVFGAGGNLSLIHISEPTRPY